MFNQGFKIHKSLDVRDLQWIFCLVTTENCDDDINTANKYDSCGQVMKLFLIFYP